MIARQPALERNRRLWGASFEEPAGRPVRIAPASCTFAMFACSIIALHWGDTPPCGLKRGSSSARLSYGTDVFAVSTFSISARVGARQKCRVLQRGAALTFSSDPPRRSAFRRRALSMMMRRIASAAAAQNSARLAQRGCASPCPARRNRRVKSPVKRSEKCRLAHADPPPSGCPPLISLINQARA